MNLRQMLLQRNNDDNSYDNSYDNSDGNSDDNSDDNSSSYGNSYDNSSDKMMLPIISAITKNKKEIAVKNNIL